MRVLLDESLPRQLASELGELEVATVHEKGWTGKTNGELLRLASPEFDAFLTADQNLEHQQDIARYTLRIVVLAARDNRLRRLPVEEQIELVGDVWDGIAADADAVPVPEWHLRELERRLAEPEPRYISLKELRSQLRDED